MRDMSRIASTARLPRRLHLGRVASIVAPTDQPHLLAVKSSDRGAFIRDVSAAAWDDFSRPAEVTGYGTRVQREVEERVRRGGLG